MADLFGSWANGSSLRSLQELGVYLRVTRVRLGLSLRDVQALTRVLARESGNSEYQISASWLSRVEKKNRALTSNKLAGLAAVYDLKPDQLLRIKTTASCLTHANGLPKPSDRTLRKRQRLSSGSANTLSGNLIDISLPDETTILQAEPTIRIGKYVRGVIGSKDRTLEPMILAGSIVFIDKSRKSVISGNNWTTEFDRPIYFLCTRDQYFCGFCELDEKSEWLTLVPHLLSPESSERRWKYRREVEVIGTVAAILTHRLVP